MLSPKLVLASNQSIVLFILISQARIPGIASTTGSFTHCSYRDHLIYSRVEWFLFFDWTKDRSLNPNFRGTILKKFQGASIFKKKLKIAEKQIQNLSLKLLFWTPQKARFWFIFIINRRKNVLLFSIFENGLFGWILS